MGRRLGCATAGVRLHKAAPAVRLRRTTSDSGTRSNLRIHTCPVPGPLLHLTRALQHLWVVVVTLALALSGGIGLACDSIVSAEATIQGGAASTTDIDEAAAGYIHVK